ncbi:MAG: alkaline phosphatase family protein [Chloroflexi bacterium]|nr:MAG: alkaline phosphatase family protein [Chloroflexota bacterium]
MAGAPPPLPRYGERSLSDLVPSLLAGLKVPGAPNPLGIEPVAHVCLLVIDGLGAELLREHRADAPFLAAAAGQPLTTGFPATTAASLSSIGTGRPPGEHGLVGYTIGIPGHDRALNVLLWGSYGGGPQDLREVLRPEEVQPQPTAFECAAAAGITVTAMGPAAHAHSGMTRAVLRGARYAPVFGLGDLAIEASSTARTSQRSLVYAYHPDLDLIGHARGAGSAGWSAHLVHVDRLAAGLAERLPKDTLLVVTGDHGMIDLAPDQLVDVDREPVLLHGVRLVAGEARARHVYARPGAADDVLAAWRDRLGASMWIATREEAIGAGWFGPTVSDRVRDRIGDVVAAAFAPIGIVQRSLDPRQASMRGHHGSFTPEEQLVPFIAVRR